MHTAPNYDGAADTCQQNGCQDCHPRAVGLKDQNIIITNLSQERRNTMNYYALIHYPEDSQYGELKRLTTDENAIQVPGEFSKLIGFNTDEKHPESYVVEIYTGIVWDEDEVIPTDLDELYEVLHELGVSDVEPWGRPADVEAWKLSKDV